MRQKTINVDVLEGKNKQEEEDRFTESIMSPAFRHSLTADYFATTIGGRDKLDPASTLAVFEARISKVKDNDMSDIESMLVAQSITLDSIFHEMAFRSALNIGEYLPAVNSYMKLALKAQAQCRTTIETLNEMKNPKTVTITKQANISDQQIVNNGVINTDNSRAKKNKSQSNELLEEIKHERLDTRTSKTTSSTNQEMETLETLNRCKNSKG